ncbi:MAG TPA: hypothetical protein VJ907_05845 [Halanaerobiales bacterium]|nr:hypothetical protein [Halanaerobiales bacterium]
MTITEMHNAVRLGLDKTSALEVPSFESEELDHWLNKAIERFVKTRYSGVNVKKESFEQTQKRIDDLRTLVKSTDLILYARSVEFPNAYIVDDEENDWPSDYLFTISEEALATINGEEKRVGVVQCTHDEYREAIDNPYSEHILHYNSAKPLRLFYEYNVILITDGQYTLSNYYLTYLRVPATVDFDADTPIDCDLPEHTHSEIVDMTVNMLLENIEQPRYKTHSAEVAMME